jgi:hypothetical protein
MALISSNGLSPAYFSFLFLFLSFFSITFVRVTVSKVTTRYSFIHSILLILLVLAIITK